MFRLRIKIFFLFYLSIISSDVNAKAVLKMDVRFTNDSIFINSAINLNKQTKFVILNSVANIKSITSNNNKITKWVLKNDTIFFKNFYQSIDISYAFYKNDFTLKDGTIILKNEGKWFPSVKNKIFDAKIKTSYKEDKYFIVINKDTIINEEDVIRNTNDITIILLSRIKYNKLSTITNGIELTFYKPKSVQVDTIFMNEFLNSYVFFNKFFNTKYSELNIVNIGSEDFNICQSLKKIILFGNYFYTLYSQNKENSWIPHEVCHQWWGKSIFFNSDSTNYRFIEESVAEFLKTIYIKNQYNAINYTKMLNNYKTMFDYVIKDNNQKSISDIKTLNNQINSIIIYCKGPLILIYLEKKYSDCYFKNICQNFFYKHDNQVVSFDNFDNEIKLYSKKCSFDLKEMLNSNMKFW